MNSVERVRERRGRSNSRRVRGIEGFTLVELMIALALGLLILAGLVTLFANTSVARGEIDKSSRQIENGRFATQKLTDEIRLAGYYGALASAPAVPAAVPDPCSTTLADVQAAIGIPLQGYAGTTAAAMSATLSCLGAAAGYKPNTDVLVIRRAGTGAPAAAPVAGSFNVQVSGCSGDTTPYTLSNDVAANFALHSNASPPGCTPLASASAALISPMHIRIYFVSTCSNASCAAGADTIPTLKRIDVTPTGTTITPIVDGIEELRLEYGLDATAPFDGAPDTYTTIPPPATTDAILGLAWNNVMAVRVHVLARNIDPTVGYTDTKTYPLGGANVTPGGAYKRHAYSEVARLNNPSGRRE